MKERTKVSSGAWLCILALTLLSLFAGCKRSENADTSSTQPLQPAGPGYFETTFQTESEFVVESIVTDIAEMLYFAKNHDVPTAKNVVVRAKEAAGSAETPTFEVSVQFDNAPPIKSQLKVAGPIWSPAVYADLTTELAKALKLRSPAAAPRPDVSLLEELTDGLATTIARADLELSAKMETDFNNPTLHEQAAALLGAFIFRECSGAFYDIRLPLNRMTAHLALARFLAGKNPPGPVGQVAEDMLLLGMNNQADVLKQLEHLDTKPAPVATWARVLRAGATLDFRPLMAATNSPGIEQLAWFATYSAANNRAVAWNTVGKAVQEKPDFCRIVASMGYDVGMGNVMLQIWQPLELQEIKDVYKVMHERELRKEDLVPALNAEPDRGFIPASGDAVGVRVIGWGLWALQMQHHLCLAVSTDYRSLHGKLGLREESAQFAEEAGGRYGKLRFYDFVRRLDCTNTESYHQATDAGWAFTVKYPHLTPSSWMVYLCSRPSFAKQYNPIPNPHCNEWTSHNPLPGTAYDVSARVNFPSLVPDRGDISKILKAHERAPYDLGISEYIAQWYGTNWNSKVANEIFGPMLPYSSVAATWIANAQAGDPEQYEKTMKLGARWNPFLYGTLADYQWRIGQTNEAMKNYELRDEVDTDAVTMANIAERRVRYYLATGQKEKAKEVADFAGEVYSQLGLKAKGFYLEQTGDLAGAFEWYRKIEERYDWPDDLLFFCTRHTAPTGDTDLDSRIRGRLQTWANQRQKVSLGSFSGTPTNGVRLSGLSEPLKKLFIKDGDVVVAVRGLRVENIAQYFLARDMEPATEMKIIYWHGSGYHESTVTLNSERRMGATVTDYRVR